MRQLPHTVVRSLSISTRVRIMHNLSIGQTAAHVSGNKCQFGDVPLFPALIEDTATSCTCQIEPLPLGLTDNLPARAVPLAALEGRGLFCGIRLVKTI